MLLCAPFLHLAPLNLPDTQVSRDQGHYLPPTHPPNLELEDRKEQGRQRRGGRSRKGGGEEARGKVGRGVGRSRRRRRRGRRTRREGSKTWKKGEWS